MSSSLLAIFWPKRGAKSGKRGHKRRRKHRTREPQTPGVRALEKLVVEEIEVGDVANTPPMGIPSKPRRARAAWIMSAKLTFAWIGLALLPVLASLFARSPWPIDETRTLAIAWEMWSQGVFVPTLNGAIDHAQPPLLFWLINLGWYAFGLNDWWPRLLPAMFAIGSLLLTQRLARALWPDQQDITHYAPFLLLAMVFWTFCVTLAGGDLLLVFFTLLGACGVVAIWQGRRKFGWLALGCALGFGLLTAGLAILIYLLPVTLLAPMWASDIRWGRWYGDVSKALLVAVVIAGGCAMLLAKQVGAAYMQSLAAIPLGPASVTFFLPAQPWWWYLAVLPVILLPWSIFPLVWMRFWHIRREKMNVGLAFCLFWAWPAFVLLSLITTKQPQFLLPILPAFALGMAHLLLDESFADHGHDSILSSMAFPLIVVGGLLAAVPGLPRVEALPAMLWESRSAYIGIAVAMIGIALAWLPLPEIKQRVMNIAVGGVSLLVIAILGIGLQFDKLYEVNPVANYLAAAQRQGKAIASVEPYQGQFQFAGRLL
ncbi:MAG: ArnT family glycosyltransferase, partial [Acidiferrobacterales bacterium]